MLMKLYLADPFKELVVLVLALPLAAALGFCKRPSGDGLLAFAIWRLDEATPVCYSSTEALFPVPY